MLLEEEFGGGRIGGFRTRMTLKTGPSRGLVSKRLCIKIERERESKICTRAEPMRMQSSKSHGVFECVGRKYEDFSWRTCFLRRDLAEKNSPPEFETHSKGAFSIELFFQIVTKRRFAFLKHHLQIKKQTFTGFRKPFSNENTKRHI